MSNLTFLSDNRVLEASLSMITGTENAQFPLENIQHDFTTKVFRSNEDTVEILVDLKQSVAIDSFAVVGSSVTGLGFGDVSIYGSLSTNFTGSTEVSVDVSAEHNFGFKLWNAGGSFRYWKIVINNTGGDYVELSNLYLGIRTEVTNGLDLNSFKYSQVDNSKIKMNDYGQRFIDSFNKTKLLSGQIKFLNKQEFDTINNLYIQHGKSIPIWVIVDPDGVMASDGEYLFSGYFYFTKDLSYASAGPFLYNVELSFSEAT
tara:strand:- start:3195 stop:3971 length:777 start_codon:yes stop_codon:yes gene_type:complete